MRYHSIAEMIQDLEKNPIETSGHIYHPIPFEEFDHLKTSTISAEVYRKWSIIEKVTETIFMSGLNGIKVLDIGANAGFYTFSFAKKGANVTAFESHPRYAPVGEIIVKEKNLPVNWIGGSFDFSIVKGEQFDLTLMLSVFQWISDGNKKIDEALKTLKNVSTISKYLIFELGCNSGKSAIVTNKINDLAYIYSLLSANTVYKNIRLIGSTMVWGQRASRYIFVCSSENLHIKEPLYSFLKFVNI